MKKITNIKDKQTEPLNIAISGRDAELLLVLIGNNNIQHCRAAADTPYGIRYTANEDEIDGMTEELFDLLDNHVRGV